MQTVKINLENCYGIGLLNFDFEFNNESKSYSIYAPNGFMKSSFAKALMNMAEATDIVHPERPTKCNVTDDAGTNISQDNIFVIEPYKEKFTSDKVSLLLVNPTIKKAYDEALLKIENKKDGLLKSLKQLSGLTGKTTTPESELLKCFEQKSVFDLLESLETKINSLLDTDLSKLSYNALFNDKTIAFLASGQIKTQLQDYVEKYNELVENSPILSKSFNHYHAKTIEKNLTDNGFFKAEHSVNLFDSIKKIKEEVTSAVDLSAKIEIEKQKIFANEDLTKKFDDIEKKITTKELREFRDYLLENKEILAELADYKQLQLKLLLSYLIREKQLVNELLKEYKTNKPIIQKAISDANNEKTEWLEVLAEFKERYTVPFNLKVSNLEDVILKDATVPTLEFDFNDGTPKSINENSLLQVLSQGEKRALYILNIIFEIKARNKLATKTLIVADDIADSFDYKNKYALVEYLQEISEQSNFRLIFLTHNFDFHRTISSRLKMPREKRLTAIKNGRTLKLQPEHYQHNPFEHWQKNFNNPRYVISSICFVRNLAQYCNLEQEFVKLTSLLHIKNDTDAFLFQELSAIYQKVLNKPTIQLPNPTSQILQNIFDTADTIETEADERAELESKIILSIAIRLKVEKVIIDKINDHLITDPIQNDSYQTRALINAFQNKFPTDNTTIKLLKEVNIMTPENIHLNSFMYEPILDMSPSQLKTLYKSVKAI
jgi:energy-coupling factor transporter ATP-binding protein EcfA2